MTSRILACAALLVVAGFVAAPIGGIEAQTASSRPVRATIDGIPDTGQFLPDTAILARVEGRVIRVEDFVDRYFNSFVQYRPASDSLGRVEFLNSMINKEVLALTARAADRPLTFEDRAALRESEGQALSNLLYRRAVLDSIDFSEEMFQRVYDEYQHTLRLRHILVEDHETAQRIRAEIVAKKISWEDAVEKYSLDRDRSAPDGDIGWKVRIGMDAIVAHGVFPLQPGEISQPVEDGEGVHLMQCVERRRVEVPTLESLRGQIRDDIRRIRGSEISRRFMTRLAETIDMTYDSTLIRQVARRFARPAQRLEGGVLTVDPNLPEFTPEELSWVLARHRDGELRLDELVHKYAEIPAVARPPVNTFNAVIGQIHAITLEPLRQDHARAMGLEKDPVFLAIMDRRTEELRVQHLFQDSVLTHVSVEPDERRRYYEANSARYITFPKVRYARFHFERESLADSVNARLEAGEDAEQIIASGIMTGHSNAEIAERYNNEPGMETTLLFEELRPGEVRRLGPDGHGHSSLYQVISLDPGQQIPFEDASAMVDETLRNQKAEAALKAFIERRKKHYRIEASPDLVTRIRLVDPAMWSD